MPDTDVEGRFSRREARGHRFETRAAGDRKLYRRGGSIRRRSGHPLPARTTTPCPVVRH